MCNELLLGGHIHSNWHAYKLMCEQIYYVHAYIRVCIHTFMHTKHALLHASVRTHAHMYVHTFAHTCAYTSTHKSFKYMNTYICKYRLNACSVDPRANFAEREREKHQMCDEYFTNACGSEHNKYF